MSKMKDLAVQRAVDGFWGRLAKDKIPLGSDLKSATAAARNAALTILQDENQLQQAFPNHSEVSRRQLPLFLLKLAPPLSIPGPTLHLQLAPWRIAVASLIGGLIGVFALTPLTHYLLGMRDLGLLLGGPLGAGGMVWLTMKIAEESFLKKTVGAALGLAALTEVLLFLQHGNPVGLLWSKLSGNKHGIVRRLGLYLLVLLMLLISKKEQRFDQANYAQIVRAQIESWVVCLLTCVDLFQAKEEGEDGDKTQDKVIAHLGAKLLLLHQSSFDDLAVVAHELLMESRNLGFDGFSGEPRFLAERSADQRNKGGKAASSAATGAGDAALPNTFRWEEELASSYETFGAIEPGDLVRETRSPVLFHGKVHEKGLVRKVRKA